MSIAGSVLALFLALLMLAFIFAAFWWLMDVWYNWEQKQERIGKYMEFYLTTEVNGTPYVTANGPWRRERKARKLAKKYEKKTNGREP